MLVMTDGDNTAGLYEPLEASNIARGFGIDVYAIGIGGNIEVEQQQVSCSNNLLLLRYWLASRCGKISRCKDFFLYLP